MGHTLIRCIAILLLSAAAVSTVAQTPANLVAQAPAKSTTQTAPKPPDMVCFGNNPDWSIQFLAGWARYVGINQPDKDFLGRFIWVPEDKAWAWQRTNEFLAPLSGLSAVIKEASCMDPGHKETFPYSAQVNLPEGDRVNGCCRKLKAGEAPVGPHGVPSSNPPQQ